MASWSTVLGNVASFASLGSKTNWKLSQHLQTKSGQLQEISKSFVDRAKTLQIISFYETDKMDFLNQRVVDEDSAVLGFPDEVSIGIPGNHRSMCRFDSINEQRYRCVWTNIQNLAGSASNPSRSMAWLSQSWQSGANEFARASRYRRSRSSKFRKWRESPTERPIPAVFDQKAEGNEVSRCGTTVEIGLPWRRLWPPQPGRRSRVYKPDRNQTSAEAGSRSTEGRTESPNELPETVA